MPVHPKGNQSWIFIGRTDAEAEAPVLWPPNAKNQLTGKDADAGKNWRQEEKGMTEDEMVGWYHRLYGHEFEPAPQVGEGQGGLVCCSSWCHKESDTTEQLKKNKVSCISCPNQKFYLSLFWFCFISIDGWHYSFIIVWKFLLQFTKKKLGFWGERTNETSFSECCQNRL